MQKDVGDLVGGLFLRPSLCSPQWLSWDSRGPDPRVSISFTEVTW